MAVFRPAHWGLSPISIVSSTYTSDHHPSEVIIDAIDNPVPTNANAIEIITSAELGGALPGISLELVDPSSDASLQIARERSQIAGGMSCEFDCVSHISSESLEIKLVFQIFPRGRPFAESVAKSRFGIPHVSHIICVFDRDFEQFINPPATLTPY